MSCIKVDMIQHYIDGESTPNNAATIEQHIADCKRCAEAVMHQKRLSAGVIHALNHLTTETNDVPAFVRPETHINKRFTTLKKIVYSVAAACILLFVFLFLHKKETPSTYQITYIQSFGQNVDANKPITQQELVINIIDENGNVTEY